MNRVWKKFFRNMSGPILTILYTFGVVSASLWAIENLNPLVGYGILILWIVFPVLGFVIRDMWRDAKREVEWENDEMMRRIRGQ